MALLRKNLLASAQAYVCGQAGNEAEHDKRFIISSGSGVQIVDCMWVVPWFRAHLLDSSVLGSGDNGTENSARNQMNDIATKYQAWMLASTPRPWG
jgi:hypothetical protein